MKIDKNMVVMGVTVVSGIVSVGAALYSLYRDLKVVNKVDEAVERIEDSNAIEISDKLVEKTVERVVERKVSDDVEEVSKKIVKEHTAQLKDAVSKAVQSQYDQVKEDVLAATKEQVAKIDVKKLKQEVKAEVKEKVYRKMDQIMEDGARDFRRNLERYSNISGGNSSGLVSLNIG